MLDRPFSKGVNLNNLSWTGGQTPSTGTGPTFTTKWSEAAHQTITATIPNGSGCVQVAQASTSKQKTGKTTKVIDLVLNDTGNTDVFTGTPANQIDSFVTVKKAGEYVVLKAETAPDNDPTEWEEIQWQGGEAIPNGAKNLHRVSKAAATTPPVIVTATIGSSSASKRVVVVWVTFTEFRIEAPQGQDTFVKPSEWGTPQDKAFNGMRIRATVAPTDVASYGAHFDFFRLKEGVAWGKKNGTWTQGDSFGPPPQNDDHREDDENDDPVDGNMYVVDNPGFPDPPPTADSEFVMKASFIESVWMEVGLDPPPPVKVSDDYPWRSLIWCEAYTDEQQNVKWRRKNGKPNEIDDGGITAPDSIIHDPNRDPTTW